ncbi:MAG TPA: CCA tRNA nucleotidyltransferase [Gemmatimonadales bacterium]|nr:CCA tRNA nucleotidyltransferase [Gemmatimonadales bacterium]HRZ09366.1 CCA tRNA nucleotidyltransferase [Gemmatimonadales bacterium]
MVLPARIPIPDEVIAIARRLEEAGHEAWCVGGAVRDSLLGGEQKDFDLATSATPEQVQRLFKRTVAVGVKYGTVGVFDGDRVLHEVTTFRHDVRTDGRHAEVAFGVSLDEDLARRDFTVNAIAFHPLRGEWKDPFGGAEDLGRRRLRAVGDPAARFREDYLRVLRALRFAARLDFIIDPPTWEAACAAAAGLGQLSAERVRDEWTKGLATTRSLRRLISLWRKSGAAAVWLPQLRSDEELEAWTGDDAPARRDPVVLTALCCHDPVAVLGRLRVSNSDLARAAALVTGPPAPAGMTSRDVRRWLAAVDGAADDLAELWQLRHAAPFPWAAEVAAIRGAGAPLRRGDLAITGQDLMAAGIPAGPAVGQVLERLLALVVDEPTLNVHEALLERAKELA